MFASLCFQLKADEIEIIKDMEWSSEACVSTCRAAEEKDFLSQDARSKHAEGQSRLQSFIRQSMASVNKAHPGSAENRQDSENAIELPVSNVIVAGGKIQKIDFSSFMQGPPIL